MKRILALAAGSAAVVALAAVPASAKIAISAVGTAAAHAPRLHVINLHAAYERSVPHAGTRRIGGVVPSRAARLMPSKARAAAAGCTEPNCDLVYNGGPVQHSPHVYLLLWGPDWTSTSPAYSYLYYLYDGLGASPKDTWSPITSQYGDGTGAPLFGTTVFVGAYQDTSVPPNPVTPDDLAAEAAGFVTGQGITDVADAQIVIASQSGTCFSDGFIGSCGVPGTATTGYCGWHSITTSGVPFTNLPYQLDAGYECGENFINGGTAGEYDGFTVIGAHEYAETITDPNPTTGWTDPSDAISGGGQPAEVADKCVWGGSNWGPLGSDPYGDITLSTGSFAMQSLWSNAAGRCVLTTSPTLAVATPGTQKSTLGVRSSLQIHASSNTGGALSYHASALPPGMSIGAASGTITGTPGVTAGTYKANVTVSDYAGSRTVSFTWQVSSKAGPVKGYRGRCADDYKNRSGNGSKIDIWTCNRQGRQRFTFTASGELQINGKCVTNHRGRAVLEACKGSAMQTWTRKADGEYVTGKDCLTDPGRSLKNGTQLRLQACTAANDQRWSLP